MNVKLIKNETENSYIENQKSITTLLEYIKEKNTQCTINNSKLRMVHRQIDRITLDFKQIYEGLIRLEIKSSNLNIAAEAIQDRNNLVERIYSTVADEVNRQMSKQT